MSEVHYVVGRQPLRVGEELKQPGEVIPNAETWRNLHTWLSWGRVVRVEGPAPTAEEQDATPAPVEQAAELLAPEQTLEVDNASDEAAQATGEDLAAAATETEVAAEETTEAS